MDHTRHLKAIWHSFSKGDEAKAIKEEERQTNDFLKALKAAEGGASDFSYSKGGDEAEKKKKKDKDKAFKLALSVRVCNGRFTGRVETLECSVNFSRIDFRVEMRALTLVISWPRGAHHGPCASRQSRCTLEQTSRWTSD